jgi:uncharacterized protein YjiS (DUF1127 family)
MSTINACETTKPTGARAALAAAAAAAAAKTGALYRAFVNRRALYRLGEMSDIELADIGLSRSDLFVVRSAPAHTDPTARLGALAYINRTQDAARCTG